jgi:hypothetical protein
VSTFTAFPDVEAGLLVALEDLGYTVTSTPIDMKDILAGTGAYTTPTDVIRIQRIGGAHGENRATDEPRVTVDVFKLRNPDNPRAPIQKALAVEARLLSLSDVITIPTEFGGGRCRIDGVVTESGPVEFPWPDPDIQVVRLISRASTRR